MYVKCQKNDCIRKKKKGTRQVDILSSYDIEVFRSLHIILYLKSSWSCMSKLLILGQRTSSTNYRIKPLNLNFPHHTYLRLYLSYFQVFGWQRNCCTVRSFITWICLIADSSYLTIPFLLMVKELSVIRNLLQ